MLRPCAARWACVWQPKAGGAILKKLIRPGEARWTQAWFAEVGFGQAV